MNVTFFIVFCDLVLLISISIIVQFFTILFYWYSSNNCNLNECIFTTGINCNSWYCIFRNTLAIKLSWYHLLAIVRKCVYVIRESNNAWNLLNYQFPHLYAIHIILSSCRFYNFFSKHIRSNTALRCIYNQKKSTPSQQCIFVWVVILIRK